MTRVERAEAWAAVMMLLVAVGAIAALWISGMWRVLAFWVAWVAR